VSATGGGPPLQPRASPFLAQCSYITGLLDLVGGGDTSASAAADQSADLPEVPIPEQFSRQDVTDLLRVVEGRDPEIAASPDPADVALTLNISAWAVPAGATGAPPPAPDACGRE
jgi:hypothetical protein